MLQIYMHVCVCLRVCWRMFVFACLHVTEQMRVCVAEWLCMCLQSVLETEGFGFHLAFCPMDHSTTTACSVVLQISLPPPFSTPTLKLRSWALAVVSCRLLLPEKMDP